MTADTRISPYLFSILRSNHRMDSETIKHFVCDFYEIPKESIEGKTQVREVVDARNIYLALCVACSGLKYLDVGKTVNRSQSKVAQAQKLTKCIFGLRAEFERLEKEFLKKFNQI